MSFLERPEWTTEINRRGCLKGVERAANFAHLFVAISEATKQAFLRHFPAITPQRVHVIHPASRFGQQGFRPKPKPPAHKIFRTGSPFFPTTGTIEPRKNQTFLLEVYQQYRNRGGPSIPLVFAGTQCWMMDDFDQQVAVSPWAEDIHILGYVGARELTWLYQNCLINLYPSHYEGFGLPVLEGLYFGTPVVCSRSSSMPEIVGEAGILLPPDDRSGWVQAMETLVSEPQQRDKLHQAAVARAGRFDWRRSVARVRRLYETAGG